MLDPLIAFTYILYSQSLDKYYVGFTTELPEIRVYRHNTDYYEGAFTKKGKPWTLFLSIELESIDLARKMEMHIKKMKSRRYIENLKKYPEIIELLKVQLGTHNQSR